MAKKPTVHRAIYLIRKRQELLGFVDATDEPSAIAAAIKEHNIADPERQKRLITKRSG